MSEEALHKKQGRKRKIFPTKYRAPDNSRERYTQLNTEFQRIARRKPSSVINAKKQRKIIEWERLEISRKLGL